MNTFKTKAETATKQKADMKALAAMRREKRMKVAASIEATKQAAVKLLALKEKQYAKSSGGFEKTVSEFIVYFQNFVTDPSFFVPFIIVIYLVFSFSNAGESKTDPINTFINGFKIKNPKLFTLLSTNIVKFIAALSFIPSLMALPSDKRVTFAIVVIIYIFAFTQRSAYEYILDGMLASMYLKTNVKSLKYTILFIAAVIYFVGFSPDTWFGSSTITSTPVPSTTTVRP